MTEKRSDYRKKQSRQKSRKLFERVKSAFDDDQTDHEEVDVNPEFQRTEVERHPLEGNGQENYYQEEIDNRHSRPNYDKASRLKKRLNSAILIVFVLIILVLVALFHL